MNSLSKHTTYTETSELQAKTPIAKETEERGDQRRGGEVDDMNEEERELYLCLERRRSQHLGLVFEYLSSRIQC